MCRRWGYTLETPKNNKNEGCTTPLKIYQKRGGTPIKICKKKRKKKGGGAGHSPPPSLDDKKKYKGT